MSHQPNDGHPLVKVYFGQNEINLLVSHESDADLRAWVMAVFSDTLHSLVTQVYLPDGDQYIIPFPVIHLPTMQLKDITLEGNALPNKSLLALRVRPLQREPRQDGRSEDDQQLANAILHINSQIKDVDQGQEFPEGGPGVRVHAAAPNWLFAGTQHQIIDGGPGGDPVPDSGGSASKHFTVQIETSAQHVSAVDVNCIAPKVAVFILDTIPGPDFQTEVARRTANNLLQNVSNKLSAGHIVPVADLGGIALPLGPDQGLGSVSHRGYYEISDHGLFIAGLIYTLAPSADLYLLETLNSYGAGSVENLTQAINGIQSRLNGATRVVVNFSFCISFLSTDELLQLCNWLVPPEYASFDDYVKKVLLKPLEDAIDALYNIPGVQVAIVAAAGNDGDGTNHPEPRYPAALSRVIGVGACDNSGAIAGYSNIDDDPTSDGLVTYGGLTKAITPGDEPITDDKTGLLGLYVGKFPNGSSPNDGWARWAGTSFSAAVMSGMIAKHALECQDIDNSNGAFFTVFKASFPAPPAKQALVINADQV